MLTNPISQRLLSIVWLSKFLNVTAVVATFNQKKALVGTFSMIVQPHQLTVCSTGYDVSLATLRVTPDVVWAPVLRISVSTVVYREAEVMKTARVTKSDVTSLGAASHDTWYSLVITEIIAWCHQSSLTLIWSFEVKLAVPDKLAVGLCTNVTT